MRDPFVPRSALARSKSERDEEDGASDRYLLLVSIHDQA